MKDCRGHVEREVKRGSKTGSRKPDMNRILDIDRQANPNISVCVRDNADSMQISSMAWFP